MAADETLIEATFFPREIEVMRPLMQIDRVLLETNDSCDIAAAKRVQSDDTGTSENIMLAVIRFILFALLHDALKTSNCVTTETNYDSDGAARPVKGSELQQMPYKHAVIGQNIKQRQFNKGGFREETLWARFPK